MEGREKGTGDGEDGVLSFFCYLMSNYVRLHEL